MAGDSKRRTDLDRCLSAIAAALDVDLGTADGRMPLDELMDSLEVLEALVIAEEHGLSVELGDDGRVLTVDDLMAALRGGP